MRLILQGGEFALDHPCQRLDRAAAEIETGSPPPGTIRAEGGSRPGPGRGGIPPSPRRVAGSCARPEARQAGRCRIPRNRTDTENVQLAVPQVRARLLMPAPIHSPPKRSISPPRPAGGRRGRGRDGNKSSVETHPPSRSRRKVQDALQVVAPRPARRRADRIRPGTGCPAIPCSWRRLRKIRSARRDRQTNPLVRGQGVEGVAGLVQDRLHVALKADGVHEDKGQAGFRKGGLVAARGFAFAVFQIEQSLLAHEGKSRAIRESERLKISSTPSIRFSIFSNGRRGGRLEGSTARSQGETSQPSFRRRPPAIPRHGHDFQLDRVVKPQAILRRVIEPAHGEGVLQIIGEAGVGGDLLAQIEKLVEKVLDASASCRRRLAHAVPRPLRARRGRFPPGNGPFAPASVPRLESHSQGADEFLVLLGEPGLLGFQRDIFLAEEVGLRLGVSVKDKISSRGEPGHEAGWSR